MPIRPIFKMHHLTPDNKWMYCKLHYRASVFTEHFLYVCSSEALTRNEGLNGLINCSHFYKSSLFQEPIIVAEKVKYLCGEGEDTLPNGNNQVKSWEDSSWISHLKSVWFCILARSHGLYFLSSFRYPVSHSSVTFSWEPSKPKGAKNWLELRTFESTLESTN